MSVSVNVSTMIALQAVPVVRVQESSSGIDDATRVACVDVLPDEKQATTVGPLLRVVT